MNSTIRQRVEEHIATVEALHEEIRLLYSRAATLDSKLRRIEDIAIDEKYSEAQRLSLIVLECE